jgi:hypothetical protein
MPQTDRAEGEGEMVGIDPCVDPGQTRRSAPDHGHHCHDLVWKSTPCGGDAREMAGWYQYLDHTRGDRAEIGN